MLRLEGYEVWDLVRETPFSEVYAGIRIDDRLRVVFKRYLGRGAASQGRAQREFELISRIEGEGVVRAVDSCASGDRHVLITERFPGFPLSRFAANRALPLDQFLTIALGIARSLAAVHDARVIHRDVKLSNVLLDPDTLCTCLIDFGISSEFGRAEAGTPPETAEGTLHYIAPEQTGRIGRGVDFRTDLYSLGATLYRLLTGQPPFASKSELELVNAHIALRPQAPADRNARIPFTLSRIVEKLLEKDPELRYQTARGLAADLEECRKQLEATGEIDDALELGLRDASDRLRFPERLYGRERESEALEAAFDRTTHNYVELMLLAGPAGIGKSALVGALRPKLMRTGGYLAEAKFDPDLQERPYAGFATALGTLVDQLLAEGATRVAQWRESLSTALGSLSGVVVELVPSLAYLLEDFSKPTPVDARDARERLALAVNRLIAELARSQHPLVLFLDDLQWADPGSRFLLDALLRSPTQQALLVIGSFRADEVGPEHPLTKVLAAVAARDVPIQRLDLAPLGMAATTSLLADALRRSEADASGLARRLGPKSQHNPLLLRRLAFHLWDRDLIRYEHGRGWTWDEAQLTEAEITDDAAAMVAARVEALPESARNLIAIASLLGSAFELELLVAVAGRDRLDVLQELMQLVDHGLIAPCRLGFKFVHDRLRDSARSKLSAEQIEELHQRAAQLLLESTPPDQLSTCAFRLAEHLAGSLGRLPPTERPRTLEILNLASRLALEQGVAETAAYYLGVARNLLGDEDWESRFPLAFATVLSSAEAAFQLRDFDQTLAFLDELDALALDPPQQVQVVVKRIAVFSMRRSPETAELGLQALDRMGVHFARRPARMRLWLDIVRTDWMLRRPLEEVGRRNASPDPNWVLPLLICSAAGPAFVRHSGALSLQASAYSLRTSLRNGPEQGLPQGLSAYLGCRTSLGRTGNLDRLAAAAAHWSEQDQTLDRALAARFARHLLVDAWTHPRRYVVAQFERVAHEAREIGKLEYVVYACLDQRSFGALAGVRLDELYVPPAALRTVRLGPLYPNYLERTYMWLREGQIDGVDWERERAAIFDRAGESDAGAPFFIVHWVAMLVFLGRFEPASEALEHVWDYVRSGAPFSWAADCVLFRGLCCSQRATRSSGRREARRLRRELGRCLKRMRAWAHIGPDFVHMAQILEAERLRLSLHVTAALSTYAKAAERARSIGYIHHAALCRELRGELLYEQRRPMESRVELIASIELYREWGANTKVAQLQQRADTLCATPRG